MHQPSPHRPARQPQTGQTQQAHPQTQESTGGREDDAGRDHHPVADSMSHQWVDQHDWVRCGDVLLDRSAYRVMAGQKSLILSMQEFRLLALLMEHADHVVPRAVILHELWGPAYHEDSNTVAVHMLRLRKKLETHPGATHHLRTVRNIGYIFDTAPV